MGRHRHPARPTAPRLLALAGVLVLTATVAGPAAAPARGDAALVPAHASTPARGPMTFAVTAPAVRGLHPGAESSLRLTVANPYPYPIVVGGFRGAVTRTSTRACAPSPANLTVRAYRGQPVLVRPLSRRATVALPLVMPATVANACQRATFTIALRATAVRAGS